FGRRIQSEIQSCRRRRRANVRFGASEVESAVFGAGGFSGLTGVVPWHCAHRNIVKTCWPILTFCGEGFVPRVVSNCVPLPASAKKVTSVFASRSSKWKVGIRTPSHGRIFITVGSLRKLNRNGDCARAPSGDKSGGRKFA